MIQFGFSVKRLSFSPRAVLDATERGTRRVLIRFGAFVRRTARQSIRKSKKISQPGRPPKSRIGHLKRLIFFSYDFGPPSVVIGPALFRSTKVKQFPLGLEALEYGGSIRRRRRFSLLTKRIVFKARPFMGPALEKELPKLTGLWRDSIVAR
ncbi:hypothetical protein LCGC14_2448070 [marine sediment metagenome]|uniref:Uncharacterized protein n=1 Tax=marine sediment metagenome TaxID=412755 RepID=A0A0F9BH02_9ZZZZ